MLLGGATFTVTPNPNTGSSTPLTVVDNTGQAGYTGADTDPTPGSFKVANVRVGTTYTVTETVAPAGYSLEANPTRTVTVPSSGTLDVSIGTQGQNDSSDFHDFRGSIAWEKRDTAGNLVGGATFTVTPNPLTGSGSLRVTL